VAVLVYSAIKNLAFDRAGVNVTTDAPISDTVFARFVNDAYADVYAISGSRIKNVASATAWTSAQTATGVVTGILTDVEELLHVYASGTSGSVGVTAGDSELDKVEASFGEYLRHSNATGTYAVPKFYWIDRLATATPASVGLLTLNYWPGVTGFYLPIKYAAQFTEIDSATVTTPDVNDLESRDIGLLTAVRICQDQDHYERVPGIIADISQRTAELLQRKLAAMMHAKQDDAERVG
jgi:hypothetical protein